jgi:GAF domain-containing protein
MLAPAGHDELLHAIAETARETFAAGACSLALLEGDELVFHVAAGGGDVIGTRVAVGEGIAGWVVASGQPIVIDDVTSDERFAGGVAEQTGYVPRSIMAMPLETDRDTLGVIEILDPQIDDLGLLELFARQAALAIESETVFRDLGRALFTAAARATGRADLAAELEGLAGRSPRPTAEMAGLAADISELVRMGGEERATAVELLRGFLDYVRRREARMV